MGEPGSDSPDRDSDYTQILPQTWGKKILSFFVSCSCWSFFFWGGGRWLDSREYFIMWRTTGDVEWRDRGTCMCEIWLFDYSWNRRACSTNRWYSTKVYIFYFLPSSSLSLSANLFVHLVSSWKAEIIISPVWWWYQSVQIGWMGM